MKLSELFTHKIIARNLAMTQDNSGDRIDDAALMEITKERVRKATSYTSADLFLDLSKMSYE